MNWKNKKKFEVMKKLLHISLLNQENNRRKSVNSRIINKINKERNRKGLPLINEGWIEETKMKQYLRQRFLKYNPLWNKRYKFLDGLELDIFIPKLRLAFEYNGKQHYKFIPYFHKTKDRFKQQLERDNKKKELCEKNNVYLITIPYNVRDIERFIDSKLNNLPHKNL